MIHWLLISSKKDSQIIARVYKGKFGAASPCVECNGCLYNKSRLGDQRFSYQLPMETPRNTVCNFIVNAFLTFP